MKKQPWFVYMIETTAKHLSTGITTDVEKRFETHASGKGAKFFRIHTPKKIVYIKKYRTKGTALSKEIQIKKLSVENKRKLIGDRKPTSKKAL